MTVLLLLGIGCLLLVFVQILLNQSGKSEHPCLGPDFRGKSFQISTSVGLIWYVEMYFLYAHFSESIYHEWMLDFVNAFSKSIYKILCLSSFF